jgi:hypothetical protein
MNRNFLIVLSVAFAVGGAALYLAQSSRYKQGVAEAITS